MCTNKEDSIPYMNFGLNLRTVITNIFHNILGSRTVSQNSSETWVFGNPSAHIAQNHTEQRVHVRRGTTVQYFSGSSEGRELGLLVRTGDGRHRCSPLTTDLGATESEELRPRVTCSQYTTGRTSTPFVTTYVVQYRLPCSIPCSTSRPIDRIL